MTASTESYADPLAQNVNQPGAAEGPGFRHQTYEPVPIGYAISPEDEDAQLSSSPVWAVDQAEWERIGGRTAGTTTADEMTLGELALGNGVVRVIGALLPMPTEQSYHPFGLANYAVTYSGYQVLQNALQWERPLPDLTLAASGHLVHDREGDDDDHGDGAERRRRAGDGRAGPLHRQRNPDRSSADDRVDPGGWVGTASVVWSTKKLKGERTITVTADPADRSPSRARRTTAPLAS